MISLHSVIIVLRQFRARQATDDDRLSPEVDGPQRSMTQCRSFTQGRWDTQFWRELSSSASCDRSELRGPMDGIWSLARYIAGPPITRDQEDFTAGGSIFHPVYWPGRE